MHVKVKQSEKIAVDHDYYYQPMSTCPTGCKVILLSQHGIAVLGQITHLDANLWAGWAPLPKIPKIQ